LKGGGGEKRPLGIKKPSSEGSSRRRLIGRVWNAKTGFTEELEKARPLQTEGVRGGIKFIMWIRTNE